MKTFNAEELKAISADIFKRYPKAQKVSVTSDGMAFITDENDRSVKNHANKNMYGKVLEIAEFTREVVVDETNNSGNTVADLVAQILAATTVEAVEAIKTSETSGKNRITVITAADKKITELNTPA